MADVGRLRVDGARELRASLKRAGHDVQDLKDAHLEVAELVARVAKPLTPLGPEDGGHIRDDIRAAGTASAAIIRVGRARRPYAGPIHWGHKARGIDPQPWVYEAAKATSGRWTGLYTDAVQKIVDRVEGTTTP